jgi:hypothetical protein
MVIKQIYFDEDTGKLMLSDDNNNHFMCNIYGDKLTEFIPGVSCILTQKERGNRFVNPDRYKLSEKAYLPGIRFFEGYTHFPRPKVAPLGNCEDYDKQKKNKEKLIDLLKSNFKCKEVQDIFNVKTDTGYPHFTAPLAKDESKSDRFRLIKIIDEYFDEYRRKNKYQLNLMPKDATVRALKRFRKLLIDNIDMNVIHGRTLNTPGNFIKRKYEAISKEMRHPKSLKPISKEAMEAIIGEKAKVPQDELSILSRETENDFKYARDNISQVKSAEFIKHALDSEKKYISGFQPVIRKEEGIIQKNLKRKFKTNGEFYNADMALFKKGIFVFKIFSQPDTI